MLIGGFQKLTLVDYPGKVASVLFTVGCNLRCQFCYNPEFVLPEKIKDTAKDLIDQNAILQFLRGQKNMLDGLVICGGEPTIHTDLLDFMRQVKDIGLLVKLDTNGRDPKTLQKCIDEKLVDYVAMDIKDSWGTRNNLVGVSEEHNPYIESIKILLNSPIEYEFRTTLIKGHHTKESFLTMLAMIKGARLYALQNFKPTDHMINMNFHGKPFMAEEIQNFVTLAKEYVNACEIRGN